MKYHFKMITLLFLFFNFHYISADIGVGISNSNQMILIDEFPFYFSSSFSIHNPSEQDTVYTIDISSPYQDVLSWFNINPMVVTVAGGGYRDITYTLSAFEGYSGEYELDITVTGYGNKGSKDENLKSSFSYLKAQGKLRLKILVTEKAGISSFGTKRPQEKELENPQETKPTIEQSSSGVIMHAFDKPVYMDIPSKLKHNSVVFLTAGCIGGNEPEGMKLNLYSPTGACYSRSLNDSFKFDEVGTWNILILIGETSIIGKSIEIESGPLYIQKYVSYAIGVLFLILLLIMIKKSMLF